MRHVLSRFLAEIGSTVRRPTRLAGLLDRRRVRRVLKSLSQPPPGAAGEWQRHERVGLRVRVYGRYEDYIRHQRAKRERMELMDYHDRFYKALRARLEAGGGLSHGMTVLCLGARQGSEVLAFRALGCFAVGIDLNPGSDNAYVLHGDFHDLAFPSGSVDVAFTNSLDHALDIERVEREVARVLKPGGVFVVEAGRGRDEGGTPGAYESLSWSAIDDLVGLLEGSGFRLISRSPFDEPWPGEHLRFRKSEQDTDRPDGSR